MEIIFITRHLHIRQKLLLEWQCWQKGGRKNSNNSTANDKYIIILLKFGFHSVLYKLGACEMESLLLKHMQYISVLTLQNDFIQLSELLMHCDRAIYSNSHMKDTCRYSLVSSLWTHLWSLLHSRSLARAFSSARPPAEKTRFLQGWRVTAVSVPFADPWVLSRTITEDAIFNELLTEAL